MLVLSNAVLAAWLLSVPVYAQANTKSLVTCVTKQGPKPTSPVKTTSAILTVPWYVYRVVKVTPQSTITPAPTTTTLTATTTFSTTITLPQETDTFSSTTTLSFSTEVTETQTASVTNTNTVTVTSSGGTTTIAAPSGFVPIESSISGAMKRAVDEAIPAANVLEERQAASPKLTYKNGKTVCSPEIYPQAVKCAGIVAVISTKISTTTVKTTKTVTAGTPTSSTTLTVSTTDTATVTPVRASTTLTFTESTTSTNTATVTATTTLQTTTTVTENLPATTYYAACAENNLITQRNGQQPSQYGAPVNDGRFQTGRANSAYDCCVQCLGLSSTCAGALFLSGGACYLSTVPEGTCSPTRAGPLVYFRSESTSGWTIIGGPCGTTTAG